MRLPSPADQHREREHRRDEHRPDADPVGQAPHDDRRDAPCQRQRRRDQPDVLVVEPEILGDHREQGIDDEPVQPQQSETERQDQHNLEFVVPPEPRIASHALSPPRKPPVELMPCGDPE
jgi:hypothetical protein